MENLIKLTPKKKQTIGKIIKAAQESNGLIGDIAAKAHLSRVSVWKYVKEFPEVADAVDDAREKLYDHVESKLIQKIDDGDITAIIFFLKTRCKHRGYSEKQEIEDPKDVVIRVVYDDEIVRDSSS